MFHVLTIRGHKVYIIRAMNGTIKLSYVTHATYGNVYSEQVRVERVFTTPGSVIAYIRSRLAASSLGPSVFATKAV